MFRSRSFQKNLLYSVGGVFIVFAACFSVYQYYREKNYKIDILESRLQMYNYQMMQTLGPGKLCDRDEFDQYVAQHKIKGLRVSIIRADGTVILDSQDHDVDSMGNHLEREEVRQALRQGYGYDIKRTSESTNTTYFYSATFFPSDSINNNSRSGLIIRTAVPYSAELTRSLQADNTYLYFALLLTLTLGIVLYYNTSRISRHIRSLREFASKAESDDELDHELERKLPDDELGDISHTIIAQYWKLKHSEEDKARIKRQLTQNAAHELKTPAASIQGYLETILQHPDMDETKRMHFLERCYTQSKRMSDLLLDMSTLTKLDEIVKTGNNSNGFQGGKPVNVTDVINSVLDDTALQFQQKGLKVCLNVPNKVVVKGDQGLIYSIFRNLIDNILAYATGATKVSIVCIEVEDGGVKSYEFTVSDNGVGVEPQHLSHLFERFYRVDKGRSRKAGGTGLGLSIVKNAVAVHGGKVSAELTPGGGLTVRFNLNR